MLPTWTSLVLLLLAHLCPGSWAEVGRLVCFYDANSFVREGPAQLSISELEPALNFCNILVYGYAGIDPATFRINSLDSGLLKQRDHYRVITALKKKFPHVRFLLSVGGDRDLNEEGVADTLKYLSLLEDAGRHKSFVSSVNDELANYGFDGLDLAWQFPKNKPKVKRGALKKAWGYVKGWFSTPSIDPNSEEHKAQFATLVRELKTEFQRSGKLLSLTMLPHVDAEMFIDISTVINHVDFVNLGTYDFQTPERNPGVGDLPTPLYAPYDRDPTQNVDYQLHHWLNNSANPQKLHIGVTTFGRAWHMSRDSGITGYPPIPDTVGAAPMGRQTSIGGLLSWPEVCDMLQIPPVGKDGNSGLRKVGDPTKRFGIYAYRAADDAGQNGLWVGYEDPTSAAIKADYAHANGLGGVALFELSLDDFRGQCAGEKYPILRSIKYKL